MTETAQWDLLQQAQQLFDAGKYGDALLVYDEVIGATRGKQDGAFSQSIMRKGLCSLYLADYDLAGRMFEDAAQADVNNSDPLFYVLLLQIIFEWEDVEIESTVRKLLTVNPGVASDIDRLLAPVPGELLPDRVYQQLRQKLAKV